MQGLWMRVTERLTYLQPLQACLVGRSEVVESTSVVRGDPPRGAGAIVRRHGHAQRHGRHRSHVRERHHRVRVAQPASQRLLALRPTGTTGRRLDHLDIRRRACQRTYQLLRGRTSKPCTSANPRVGCTGRRRRARFPTSRRARAWHGDPCRQTSGVPDDNRGFYTQLVRQPPCDSVLVEKKAMANMNQKTRVGASPARADWSPPPPARRSVAGSWTSRPRWHGAPTAGAGVSRPSPRSWRFPTPRGRPAAAAAAARRRPPWTRAAAPG
jgi:hypothetical protein